MLDPPNVWDGACLLTLAQAHRRSSSYHDMVFSVNWGGPVLGSYMGHPVIVLKKFKCKNGSLENTHDGNRATPLPEAPWQDPKSRTPVFWSLVLPLWRRLQNPKVDRVLDTYIFYTGPTVLGLVSTRTQRWDLRFGSTQPS